MKLTRTAKAVLKQRYLLKNKKGKVAETAEGMFKRVASEISGIDALYGQEKKSSEKEFFSAMKSLDFLPNSPTLMNAGTQIPQMSACFVLPVDDSIESIFDSLKNMALIHQSGGGVGFSFSRLRPEGDIVSTSKGISSGPVSFMRIFDTATEVMKSGGRRRGANMGILNANHPDILGFVSAKERGDLPNFNLSVGASDRFMEAARKKKSMALVNPRTGKTEKRESAAKIFSEAAKNAWETGDPGMVFLDEINRRHPLKEEIEATNPCGEQPLLPYESCNLGSINLSNMANSRKIDWEKLRKTVHLGVHFLDNVIDASVSPLVQIGKTTGRSRKIGLGVMGFADMLIKLGIRYDSKEAVKAAEDVMRFISKEARIKSEGLARKRGSFPDFRKSRLAQKHRAMRNATLTTIAPTGTISIIAGTSSGIEPLFALKFTRQILGKKKFTEENPLWKSGKYDKKLFVTAMDVKPEQHVKIQAAFQKHTDNAVSKTVNLPEDAKEGDVRKIFMLAHKLKCKGITVYRYGSRKEQVLNTCPTC